MEFNRYFTNQEVEEIIKEWQQRYPNLMKVSVLGESFEKRPIWLLTLTNRDTGDDRSKPAVWMDANIHSVEVSGTTTVLDIAYTLLEGYGKDARITRLLDECAYYLVPRVNPDGAAWAMAKNPRFVRSGVRPYPWEDKQDGLHRQDIDGDGRILQMRVEDPYGDWKVSALDARLMQKREPHEHGGTYYRLFPEGLLEDYDGYLIKIARPQQGLDFNRNFPFEWRTEGEQEGAGPYPTSEPETRAMIDFIVQHANINLAVTYHTFSRVILRSYSTKPDEAMETEDLWVLQKIGEIGTQITGYPCVSTFHDFKYHPKRVTSGAFDDWMFDHLGVFAYTIELWDLPNEAGIKDRKFIEWYRQHPHEDDLKILKWIEEHGEPDAYVDWYPFEHPQLGHVELGGWNLMYSWWNPPKGYIAAEAARNVPFALALGDLLPHVRIHTLQTTRIGQEDFNLHLVVENTGFLPTYTSVQGKKRSAVRPVRAELHLPAECSLVTGKRRVELGHLEGRSNKLSVASVWETSPTDNRARTEWVVRAPVGTKIEVHVLSERAGIIRRTIELG